RHIRRRRRHSHLRCRTHLAGVRTLTSRVHCRYHVVVLRPVRHPGVGVARRGGTGDGRVRPPTGGRALHVIAGRPAGGTPAQHHLPIPPSRRHIRRRRRHSHLRCRTH